MDRPQYTLYFSHSWLPEHVDLNLAFWDHLWADCLLLVDENEREDPPYFVCRIETLIRRSDLFIAVLVPPDGRHGRRGTAGAHQVSPFVLFEIALAERAHVPRLIVYDTGSRFEPRPTESRNVRYLPLSFHGLDWGRADNVWADVAEWLGTVTAAAKPQFPRRSRSAAVLLPDGPDRSDAIHTARATLQAEGYGEVADLATASNDQEILALLRSVDLLVADVGSETIWDIYGLAHSLAVPTVRILRGAEPGTSRRLPAILRGHAEGYDRDLARWSTLAELGSAIAARAQAIRQVRVEIDTREEGKEYFERRRRTAPTPRWGA
jgi:hypothetical protein